MSKNTIAGHLYEFLDQLTRVTFTQGQPLALEGRVRSVPTYLPPCRHAPPLAPSLVRWNACRG